MYIVGQLFFLVAAKLENMFLFFDHLLIAIRKIVSKNLPFLFEFAICPDEWTKMWCIFTLEYYSAIKRMK